MAELITLQYFDHKPGGVKTNELALEYTSQESAVKKDRSLLNDLRRKFSRLLELPANQRITIIVTTIFLFGFVAGEIAVSRNVYLNAADNNQLSTTLMVIGVVGMGFLGSFLLKEPFTQNMPVLSFLKPASKEEVRHEQTPTRVQLLNINGERQASKKGAGIGGILSFMIGLLIVGGTGYLVYLGSVEREMFLMQERSYLQESNSPFDLGLFKADDVAQTKTTDLPFSVWIPLLLFIGEVCTGWALIPFILLMMMYSQINSRTRALENHENRLRQLFTQIITLFRAYLLDLEDYNRRKNAQEKPIPPNPELRRILVRYDNGEHALTPESSISQEVESDRDQESDTIEYESEIGGESSEEDLNADFSSEEANLDLDKNSRPSSGNDEGYIPPFTNEEID